MRREDAIKVWTYAGLAVVLVVAFFVLETVTWPYGNTQLHTIMEVVATLFALIVGVLALVRFYAKRHSMILFLGVGFIGTALLDGYHAVVTSTFFYALFPSPPESLIPWSWNASRTFLAILMFLTWLTWRREQKLDEAARISNVAVYVGVGVLTLSSFCYFAFVPLGDAYFPEFIFGRPEEFVAAAFFAAALVGYVLKQAWREDPLDHWIVMSLLVGFICQSLFMSRSYALFDGMFHMAHTLKIVSYGLVLVGLLVDVSVSWRRERQFVAELERSNRQFRGAVESAPTAMVMIDRQGAIKLINDEAERLFDYARDELLGQAIEILVPERFRTAHPKSRSGFFASPEARRMGVGRDLYGLRKDGSEFPVEIGLSPVETDDGLFVLSAIMDITERKEFEEFQKQLLEQRKAELDFAYVAGSGLIDRDQAKSAIVRETGDELAGIESFDDAMDLWARQARNIVGAHQSAVSYIPRGNFAEGKHAISLSDKYEKYRTYDVLPTGDGIWKLVANQKLSFCMTDNELTSHSAWKNFSDMLDDRGLEHPPMRGWLAVPILSHGAKFLGVLQLSDKYEDDFTQEDLKALTRLAQLMAPAFSLQLANEELHRHSENLAVAKSALEQSNIELQHFAYIASHDLQTPLRGIVGFAQFLQKDYQGKLDEKADDYIDRIVEGAKRMHQLINDLLAYSRVESRPAPFQPTNLSEVYDDAVVLLRKSAEDAGQLTRGDLPTISGDRSQLSQLMQNLIGNAVKYRGDQPPQVHVSAENDGSKWTIAVRDHGIGIAAKHHGGIFDMFSRLHTVDKYPGTGIGLTICRRIVQRHGGTIWVESDGAEGSTFYFTIPKMSEGEGGATN